MIVVPAMLLMILAKLFISKVTKLRKNTGDSTEKGKWVAVKERDSR